MKYIVTTREGDIEVACGHSLHIEVLTDRDYGSFLEELK